MLRAAAPTGASSSRDFDHYFESPIAVVRAGSGWNSSADDFGEVRHTRFGTQQNRFNPRREVEHWAATRRSDNRGTSHYQLVAIARAANAPQILTSCLSHVPRIHCYRASLQNIDPPTAV